MTEISHSFWQYFQSVLTCLETNERVGSTGPCKLALKSPCSVISADFKVKRRVAFLKSLQGINLIVKAFP